MYFEETVQFFRRVDARHAVGYVLAGARRRRARPRAERAGARALDREPGPLPRGARRDGHGVRAEPPRQPRRRAGRARARPRVARGGAGATPRARRPQRRRHDAGQPGHPRRPRRRPRARPLAARRGAGAVRGDRRRARPDGHAAQPRQPRRRRRRARAPRASCSKRAGRWPNSSDCSAARAGRRSRWPSWRSPTATPSARPSCSTRRSGICAPLGDRWGIARCLELDQAAAKRSLSRSRQG